MPPDDDDGSVEETKLAMQKSVQSGEQEVRGCEKGLVAKQDKVQNLQKHPFHVVWDSKESQRKKKHKYKPEAVPAQHCLTKTV